MGVFEFSIGTFSRRYLQGKEDSLLIAKLKSFNNIRAIQKIVVLYFIYAVTGTISLFTHFGMTLV